MFMMAPFNNAPLNDVFQQSRVARSLFKGLNTSVRPTFQSSLNQLSADMFVSTFAANPTTNQFGFPSAMKKTEADLLRIFDTYKIKSVASEGDHQMEEYVEVTHQGSGKSEKIDSHSYDNLLYGGTFKTASSEEPLGLYNAVYPLMAKYQGPFLLVNQMTEVLKEHPELVPNNGTLNILGLGTGNGLEADVMHNALTSNNPEGVTYEAMMDNEKYHQTEALNIQFPEDVKTINFVGSDLAENAKAAAHQQYGVASMNSPEAPKSPYLSDYVTGLMREPEVQTNALNAFNDKQPDVLLSIGSLGLEGHIPYTDFKAAYNLVAPGGLVAINLQDRPLQDKKNSNRVGFEEMNEMITSSEENLYFEVLASEQRPYRLPLQDVVIDPKTHGPDLSRTFKNGVQVMTSQYIILKKKSDLPDTL
jgi:hypothetical protein